MFSACDGARFVHEYALYKFTFIHSYRVVLFV